jgi:hypothetical protein
LLDSLNLDSSNKLLHTLKLGQRKGTLPLGLSPCQSQVPEIQSSENNKSKVGDHREGHTSGFSSTCLVGVEPEGAVNGINEKVCLDRINEAQMGRELSYRLIGPGQISQYYAGGILFLSECDSSAEVRWKVESIILNGEPVGIYIDAFELQLNCIVLAIRDSALVVNTLLLDLDYKFLKRLLLDFFADKKIKKIIYNTRYVGNVLANFLD